MVLFESHSALSKVKQTEYLLQYIIYYSAASVFQHIGISQKIE